MLSFKMEIKQSPPFTARLDYRNPSKKACNYSAKNNKEIQAGSISPWAIDQFVGFAENSEGHRLPRTQTLTTKGRKNAKVQHSGLKIDDREQHRSKYKTQGSEPTGRTVRLQTIEMNENISGDVSKYHSQQIKQRKMSMHKIRFGACDAVKNYIDFHHTKVVIEKKINESNLHRQVNKKLKESKMRTLEDENKSSLLFFLEPRRNNNIMMREKNIMKIRNLTGRRMPRLKTESLF